jgi:tetratricopeptide (TPR) repeat protein
VRNSTPAEVSAATTGRGPWLPKDQQRFALVLLALVIAFSALILGTRTPALNVGKALTQVERKVRARHRSRALATVEHACKRRDCECVSTAAKAGLDVDAGTEVLALLDGAKECRGELSEAMRAEALVRADAQAKASGALASSRQPYAQTALALSLYRSNQLDAALVTVKRAIDGGRGDGATTLLGLIQYAAGDLAGARRAFSALLASEPEDLDALYDLALVAQKEGHYGESRKLYLAVLRANPKHQAARYNLGILAHSAGADAEARHHLEKLRAVDPKHPLVTDLEAALQAPPAHPPTHVLQLGAPDGKP